MDALFDAIEASSALPSTASTSIAAQPVLLPNNNVDFGPEGTSALSNRPRQTSFSTPVSAVKRTGSHRCHLCSRSYERADHLNRHLKTHENARPHKCTRCPKSFNRADLLSRHEASHSKPFPARSRGESERVLVACLACVASKCKCQDQKPCDRCVKKNIACEVGPNNTQTRLARATSYVGDSHQSMGRDETHPRASESLESSLANESNTGLLSSDDGNMRRKQTRLSDSYQSPSETRPQVSTSDPTYGSQNGVEDRVPNSGTVPPLYDNDLQQQYPILSGDFTFDQGLGFVPRESYFGQDFDFGIWDMNYAEFNMDVDTEVMTSSANSHKEPGIQPKEGKALANKHASKRYAAFERSPWLWNPTQKDHTLNDQTHLNVNQNTIALPSSPNTPVASLEQFSTCCIDPSMRDRILHLLFNLRVYHNPITTFPPLSLINLIIRVYFVQASLAVDNIIHSASFDPQTALPELLVAIIAAGATSISTPSIWKMGLVLQEIVRHTVSELWERNNSYTRNLQTLQAWITGIETGLWSGVKRKMEIAESVCQPAIMMLRRAGALSMRKESPDLLPSLEDSQPILQAKWEKFVERESFKRLVLHMFIHDVQASVGFQKPPQMSFTEIQVELPVSRDLWLADSASQWRDFYLKKQSISVPSFLEALQTPEALQQVAALVDVKYCAMVIIGGYWGQIWRLMESKKFYQSARAAYRLSLMTEQDELYRDLVSTVHKLSGMCRNDPSVGLFGEFLLMVSHVSPEDLQRFAGKYGADESRRSSEEFQSWFNTPSSRIAVWHAGQVLRVATTIMPAQLKHFSAIALYYATLTLWVYGIMLHSKDEDSVAAALGTPLSNLSHDNDSHIMLNAAETIHVTAFRGSNEGTPGLQILDDDQNLQFVPITAGNRVLRYARWIYRNNFPSTGEPLPPLLESLGNLMLDLSVTPGSSRLSRVPSEEPE